MLYQTIHLQRLTPPQKKCKIKPGTVKCLFYVRYEIHVKQYFFCTHCNGEIPVVLSDKFHIRYQNLEMPYIISLFKSLINPI